MAESFRTITDLIADREMTNAARAAECLRSLDALPGADLARPDFRAAAQTFALLAVADALTDGPSGLTIGEVIAGRGRG